MPPHAGKFSGVPVAGVEVFSHAVRLATSAVSRSSADLPARICGNTL
jgi:hypothetical protein